MAKTGVENLKARGLLFKTLAEWFHDRYGCDPKEKLETQLDAETLKILASAEKGGWYPANHLVDTLKACCQASGASSTWLPEFGGYLCQVSLTTSFRGLIVFIDPMTLMKRMPLFWRRYFNGIELRAERVNRSDTTLTIEEEIGEGLISKMFSGWLKYALEMIGADQIEVNQEKLGWDLSWQWSAD